MSEVGYMAHGQMMHTPALDKRSLPNDIVLINCDNIPCTT